MDHKSNRAKNSEFFRPSFFIYFTVFMQRSLELFLHYMSASSTVNDGSNAIKNMIVKVRIIKFIIKILSYEHMFIGFFIPRFRDDEFSSFKGYSAKINASRK